MLPTLLLQTLGTAGTDPRYQQVKPPFLSSTWGAARPYGTHLDVCQSSDSPTCYFGSSSSALCLFCFPQKRTNKIIIKKNQYFRESPWCHFIYFMMMLLIMLLPVSGLSCLSLILLIIGVHVINFSFFNQLLFKFSVHILFISQHSSQQVIYVVAFSHSGV